MSTLTHPTATAEPSTSRYWLAAASHACVWTPNRPHRDNQCPSGFALRRPAVH